MGPRDHSAPSLALSPRAYNLATNPGSVLRARRRGARAPVPMDHVQSPASGRAINCVEMLIIVMSSITHVRDIVLLQRLAALRPSAVT